MRNGIGKHYVADATDLASYKHDYDGIVCCEVLEHINEDLQTIRLWKPGTFCVCSVPNFDYPTHARFFRGEREIIERYCKLLIIEKMNGSQSHLLQFLPGRCIFAICDGRETTQSGLLPCWALINLTGMAAGLSLPPLDDKLRSLSQISGVGGSSGVVVDFIASGLERPRDPECDCRAAEAPILGRLVG